MRRGRIRVLSAHCSVDDLMGRAGDTIAALSTPPGEGAIGIVRMSGPAAIEIADRIFRGGTTVSAMASHTLHKGEICDPDTGAVADSVLIAVMRAPNSYTGEDLVEIHGHGGPLVQSETLRLIYKLGALPAQRGEFSRRAVLNGRMELSEAEALVDLIKARTRESAQNALMGLTGRARDALEGLRGGVLRALATVEACIDFPEEETLLERPALTGAIQEVRRRVAGLLLGGRRGRLMRVGLTAAIIGKPNVGKSSLLNALLEEDRAIVTPVPGTTRDYLAEWIDVAGVPLKLIDTAGLRDTDSAAEVEGVSKARQALECSDFVLVLFDWSEEMTGEDEEVLRAVGGKKKLVLVNKCDLAKGIDTSGLGEWFPVSAKFGHGLDELAKKLEVLVAAEGGPAEETVFARARHLSALERLDSHLGKSIELIDAGEKEEIIALELRDGLLAIGEIAGETTTEEVLDAVFSEFCIGK